MSEFDRAFRRMVLVCVAMILLGCVAMWWGLRDLARSPVGAAINRSLSNALCTGRPYTAKDFGDAPDAEARARQLNAECAAETARPERKAGPLSNP